MIVEILIENEIVFIFRKFIVNLFNKCCLRVLVYGFDFGGSLC